ncbi:hypothetical protein [Azoarcus sp. KH32C]|uniref:hypothetical protein n=1 Tax=Azoarcus sp. KH32C TaxID=748247 RepID=UPI0002385BB2|nr:hypothetical protein [Azoarcus sp. KH32C]BAL27301.1 hypothetical protein AZKH_p0418 [Azoarcus sp. KH32C]
MKITRDLVALVAGLVLSSAGGLAAEGRLSPEEVPQQLRPWVDWARFNAPPPECPQISGASAQAQCVWPSGLDLQLAAGAGSFALTVDAFADGVVILPGDSESWPREVRIDAQPAAVVPVDGKPAVRVGAGHRVISGRFEWRQVPLNLLLPPQVARLSVTLEGAKFPGQPDADGRLWLRERQDRQGAVDAVSVRVFRQFVDEVPMQSTVRYELSVSGQPRELRLPRAILDGFVPLSLEADLPARIDTDGSVKVQARAGSWAVNVSSRKMSPTAELNLAETAAEQEVWSFAPHNELRVVTLEGAPAVDPKSVGVPAAWATLPAFVLKPGGALRIAERQRGDSGGTADRLTVKRTLWLDFDGGGYSVQDKISGTVGRNWRLDLPEAFALGRVSINGVDQPLTRSAAGRGVELREAALALEADSRIESSDRELPASGWSIPPSVWSAELNLPPGWRLIHASGTDSVQGEWLASWTLWDLFAVLLIAAVTFRVVGTGTAAILLGGLVLSWHMPLAPKFAWLALVVLQAVARALPDQARLRGWATRGSLASAVLIAILLLPFAVTQLRQAMYPALEMNYAYTAAKRQYVPQAPRPAAAPAPAELEDRAESTLKRRDEVDAAASRQGSSSADYGAYRRIDPNVKVQTGPGIPDWQWTVVAMSAQGPLGPEQALRLTLLPPAASALWSLAAIVLLAIALWRCWPTDLGGLGRRLRGALGARAAAVLVAVGALLGTVPDEAQAQSQFPSEALLQQLRERLLAPPVAPPCTPACADLAALDIKASGNAITLRLEIHAQARTPVVLPSPGANLRPSSVLLAGKTPPLFRDEAGRIWTSVQPGISVLELTIPASVDDVPLHLPMAPRRLTTELDLWSLAGRDARGLATDTLTLSRVREAAGSGRAREFNGGAELPPLVEVERHLDLGQTWTLSTIVRRHGSSALQANVRVPLLEGEAVTDPGVTADAGEAVFDLAPGATRSFASVLAPAQVLSLRTSTYPGQIERWSVTATPLWNVQSSGLMPVAWTDGARWQPRWLPWPGESVELKVSRPAVIEGATLTIDDVQLGARVGQRSTDVTATLRLRSSTGGNHVIGLPDGAELSSVRIDGTVQPLRADGNKLALPVTPGEHSVQIEWRDRAAMDAHYVAPQLDLGAPAVNASVTLAVPQDRVVLFTRGPLVGPAVLLWGVLAVVVAVALVLPRVLPTPLSAAAWVLLGIGLVQASVAAAFLMVSWFVLLVVRRTYPPASPWRFNLLQIAILFLTMMAAGALFDALRQGLLGYPDMLIAGNGSSAFQLNWYLDRLKAVTPVVEVYSIPVFAYRLAMLAWALWLAVAITRWARWAWECYSAGGAYWRPLEGMRRSGKEGAGAIATSEAPK